MNNLLSYCELVDEKIRASDKDLPLIDKWSLTLISHRSSCSHPLLSLYTRFILNTSVDESYVLEVILFLGLISALSRLACSRFCLQ